MNNYSLTFAIDPLSDALTDRLMELDISVWTQAHLTTAESLVVGEAAVPAAQALARDLHREGAVVRRLVPDLVNMAQVARRAEVSRQAVSKWATGDQRRGAQFPLPFSLNENGPLWVWSDVNEWLRRRGKVGKFESWRTPNMRETDEVNRWLDREPVNDLLDAEIHYPLTIPLLSPLYSHAATRRTTKTLVINEVMDALH